MTDQSFDEFASDEDYIIVKAEDGQIVGEIHDGKIEAEGLNLDTVTDDRTHDDDVEFDGDKPDWSHTEHHVLAPYRHNLTVDRGPEVAFVNSALGIDGDEYTQETVSAVRQWKEEQGLPKSGHISFTDYASL